MSTTLNSLYKLQKKDLVKAGRVLNQAFRDDPLWRKIFEGESDLEKKRNACFEVPIRMSFKYGEAYAVSKNLEGIIGWVRGDKADMTLWRIICSGGILPGMRMGSRVGRKMGKVFHPIAEDRNEFMKGRDYFYIFVVGVAPHLQGKGFGKMLLNALIEKSNDESMPLYLETETEENAKMYEYFGFELIQKITLPVVDHPMWEMIREPC